MFPPGVDPFGKCCAGVAIDAEGVWAARVVDNVEDWGFLLSSRPSMEGSN